MTKISPKVVFAKLNKSFIITCLSHSVNVWRVTSPKSKYEIVNGNIIVTQADRNSKGIYECEGTNENGQIFIAQSTVYIIGKVIMVTKHALLNIKIF